MERHPRTLVTGDGLSSGEKSWEDDNPPSMMHHHKTSQAKFGVGVGADMSLKGIASKGVSYSGDQRDRNAVVVPWADGKKEHHEALGFVSAMSFRFLEAT